MEEINDGDALMKFFGVIKHFNKGFDMDPKQKAKIEEFFNYRWDNDRNIALTST